MTPIPFPTSWQTAARSGCARSVLEVHAFLAVIEQVAEFCVTVHEIQKLQALLRILPVMLGFTFDTNAVSDQLANCREIWLRYRSEVMTGVQDPEVVVPEIKAELMKAGWQDVMDVLPRSKPLPHPTD